MKSSSLAYFGSILVALASSPRSWAQNRLGQPTNPDVSPQSAPARLAGTVAPWVSRATTLEPAQESQRVVITAYLQWRNAQKLEQLVEDLSTPGSVVYGQFLSPDQFHAAFSPKPSDAQSVQEALRGLGFKIEQTPASGLFVVASGTVALAKHAFQVSQNLYGYRGKILRSHAEDPILPASLAGYVTYIGGLDDSRRLKRPANGEADVAPGELLSDNAEFIQAAAEGMSLLFAAGDGGDLTQSGSASGGPNLVASGSWPATSPYVTAMGGYENVTGLGAPNVPWLIRALELSTKELMSCAYHTR
jgi:subtilase family serine protease